LRRALHHNTLNPEAGGILAGIDSSLALLAELFGDDAQRLKSAINFREGIKHVCS
jgi:hypothetical protein